MVLLPQGNISGTWSWCPNPLTDLTRQDTFMWFELRLKDGDLLVYMFTCLTCFLSFWQLAIMYTWVYHVWVLECCALRCPWKMLFWQVVPWSCTLKLAVLMNCVLHQKTLTSCALKLCLEVVPWKVLYGKYWRAKILTSWIPKLCFEKCWTRKYCTVVLQILPTAVNTSALPWCKFFHICRKCISTKHNG